MGSIADETRKRDIEIICKECHRKFIWEVGEQEFYESKGFANPPKRCKPCRDRRKNES